MNEFAGHLRGAVWWLLPLAALAFVIGLETEWGRAVRKPVPADEPIAPKPVETALLPEYAIAGGVGARQETTSRTLFNPTRRPAPTAQDSASAQLKRGQFSLTGTALVDGRNTAFLRETTGGKSRRVQQGESINGMLVAEVKADRVRLALGDESEELVLKVATNPRPTPAAPVAGQAAPGAATPTAGAPGAPTTAGAPPIAPLPQGAAQTLAERRRAARAAEAAAAEGGASAVPQPAAPMPPPAAGQAAAPAQAIDPRWGAMDQAYRERAAQRRN